MKKKEGKKAVDKKEQKAVMIKEIDLIQGCINRMAQNSFVVKGWLITVVTVVLALLPNKININFLCVVIILATIVFWCLDAFFLRTERLYRWKYEWVIKNRISSDESEYDLNPDNAQMWMPTMKKKKIEKIINNKKKKVKEEVEVKRKKPWILRIMFTKTLWPLYCLIILFAVAILINNNFGFFDLGYATTSQQATDVQQNIFSFVKQ